MQTFLILDFDLRALIKVMRALINGGELAYLDEVVVSFQKKYIPSNLRQSGDTDRRFWFHCCFLLPTTATGDYQGEPASEGRARGHVQLFLLMLPCELKSPP